MADISKTYTNFWGWISDDAFIWPENSVTDMEGIDIQTNERYATPMDHYYTIEDYSLASTAIWFKNTPYANYVSNGSSVVRNWTTLSLWGTYYDGMESYGSGASQVNYFFDRTGWIFKFNYDWSTQIGSTITSWYPPANVQVTAIGWHITNLLFSKDNIIYYLDTATNTCSTATTLMPWSVVKLIYSVSLDTIVVVATNGLNTYIYELSFTGWAYTIVSKIEEEGRLCVSAVGDKYNVYWADSEWIHQYQGRQTQMIKYLTWITQLEYYKELRILANSGTAVYLFGAKKPWRSMSLRRIEFDGDILSNDKVLNNVSGGYKIYALSAPKRTNTIVLRPLDGWVTEIPKQELSYRFGYMFDRGDYTVWTVKQEIEVLIRTDGMEMTTDNYVSVWIVTDSSTATWNDSIGNKKYGYMDITPQMVTSALQAGNYQSTFGYVSTKILLKSGDEYAGQPWFFRKKPKIFDFTINAIYVKR